MIAEHLSAASSSIYLRCIYLLLYGAIPAVAIVRTAVHLRIDALMAGSVASGNHALSVCLLAHRSPLACCRGLRGRVGVPRGGEGLLLLRALQSRRGRSDLLIFCCPRIRDLCDLLRARCGSDGLTLLLPHEGRVVARGFLADVFSNRTRRAVQGQQEGRHHEEDRVCSAHFDSFVF